MGENVIDSIVEAVAEAKGTEPADLTVALEEHIATDGIRSFSEHDSDSWTLQFELPKHTVELRGDGEVFVDGIQR